MESAFNRQCVADMGPEISDDARTIIDAGISAARSSNGSASSSYAIIGAVEDAVGKVFGRYRGSGRSEAAPVDALREIAALYVQTLVLHDKNGNGAK